MIFNFPGIFASRFIRQSRLVGFVSRWLSFTLHISEYVIFDSGPANWRIIHSFFFYCLPPSIYTLRSGCGWRLFSLLVSILAVPLTSKRFFLGISQLDSLVTASMASSSWPMKTQTLHRSISLANKRNALLMPSFLSCSIDPPFAVTAAAGFFCLVFAGETS